MPVATRLHDAGRWLTASHTAKFFLFAPASMTYPAPVCCEHNCAPRLGLCNDVPHCTATYGVHACRAVIAGIFWHEKCAKTRWQGRKRTSASMLLPGFLLAPPFMFPLPPYQWWVHPSRLWPGHQAAPVTHSTVDACLAGQGGAGTQRMCVSACPYACGGRCHVYMQ